MYTVIAVVLAAILAATSGHAFSKQATNVSPATQTPVSTDGLAHC